jgi:hypothetical protein
MDTTSGSTRQHVDSKRYKCGASDYQLMCIRNSNVIERHFSKSRQVPDCSASPFTSSKMARKVDLVHKEERARGVQLFYT